MDLATARRIFLRRISSIKRIYDRIFEAAYEVLEHGKVLSRWKQRMVGIRYKGG